MTARCRPASVDRLAEIAVELAVRVRDEDPAANGVWLRHQLPDPRDWWRLTFVLAAGVLVDRPWRELIAWVDAPAEVRNIGVLRPDEPTKAPRPRGGLQPCGTRGAYGRHVRRKEKPCGPCTAANATYQADRKAAAA